MYLQELLLVCLISLVQVFASPEPTISQTKGQSKASRLFSGFSAFAVGSFKKFVLGNVDAKNLEETYRPAFDTIVEKLQEGACLQGLYAEADDHDTIFLMVNGSMTGLEAMEMKATILQENGDNIQALIEFILPVIPISFDFDFTEIRVFFTIHRVGKITLEQNGPVSLAFTVDLPKSSKKINDKVNANECVATVKSVKVTVPDDALKVVDVDYQSIARSVGIQITGNRVRELLKALKVAFKENIEQDLTRLIEPDFRGIDFNCNDRTYQRPAAPPTCNNYFRHAELPPGI